MPNIPTYVSREGLDNSGLERSYSRVTATADAFGAQVGRALQDAGTAIEEGTKKLFNADEDRRNKLRAENVANAIAQTNLTQPALEAQVQAPPNGAGVAKITMDKQRELIDKNAGELFPGDLKAASAYKAHMYGQLSHFQAQATQFEFQKSAEFAKDQADKSLGALGNKLRVDPSLYDITVQQGRDVIDISSAIPSFAKEAYKKAWEQNAANTRFEGMIQGAKTVDDLRVIEGELRSKDQPWTERLAQKDFEALIKHIDSGKKVFQTKADTEARSAVELLEGRSKDGVLLPPEDLQAAQKLVADSKNTMTATRMYRVVRDQQLLQQAKGLSPAELETLARDAKGGAVSMYPNLPPEVSQHISEATRAFPGVSAAYLGGTATREYGANFAKRGSGAATDYTLGTSITGADGRPTSSAKGLYQFVSKTWADFSDPAKNPEAITAVKALTGVDFATMTPEQRQAYRGDARVSTIMAAALANKNKTVLETALRRPVSDAELYMAHVFGAEGAAGLIGAYVTAGDTKAASLMPAAAYSNKPLFYQKDGSAKTVRQVYDSITTQFLASPSQVAYGDSEFWKKRRETAVAQIKENPVGYARSEGVQTVIPLTEQGGWEARGSAYTNIGKYFQIANNENKPFDSATELPELHKQFKDGTAEQVVSLLQHMARMDNTGPGSFSAGMKQLGMKDTSYDVAGQLATSDVSSAAMVVRGEKRMEADKSSKALLGEQHDARDAFNKTTGTALYALAPEARDAIRKAAYAHYVETAASQGTEKFDKTLFAKSVQTVMGGRDVPRIGYVNSATTVLPKGVDENSMEKAVDNLTPEDLMRLSVDRQGQPRSAVPMYTSGEVVKPIDISSQGKFRYVGGDVYQVQMSDGKYLVTQQREQGGFAPYLLRIDKSAVDQIASRKATAVQFDEIGMVP